MTHRFPDPPNPRWPNSDEDYSTGGPYNGDEEDSMDTPEREPEVLKPCPFCWGTRNQHEKVGYNCPVIRCLECGACGPAVSNKRADVEADWNRRPPQGDGGAVAWRWKVSENVGWTYSEHLPCFAVPFSEPLFTHPDTTLQVKGLSEALAGLRQFFDLPGENSLEKFERIADVFYRETGYLRPGKDSRTHDPEVRQAAWDKWFAEKLAAADAAIAAAPKVER